MRRCGYFENAAQFIKHFGKYGEIIDSVIMKDRKTGQPRGFGFVTYADPSVVDKVIQDTHVINGKQVGFFMLNSLFLGYILLFGFFRDWFVCGFLIVFFSFS